jgi:hypothetical protein
VKLRRILPFALVAGGIAFVLLFFEATFWKAVFLLVVLGVSFGPTLVLALIYGFVSPERRARRKVRERFISTLTAMAAASTQEAHKVLEQTVESVAEFRKRDPSFDPDAFLAWAEKAFLKLNTALGTRDFETARWFISDSVLRRFTAQIAIDDFQGRRWAIADQRVASKTIRLIQRDAEYDTILVCFKYSERACYVPSDSPDDVARARAALTSRSE